jgi:hypothetical protein
MILDFDSVCEPIIEILTIQDNDIDASVVVGVSCRLAPDGTETGSRWFRNSSLDPLVSFFQQPVRIVVFQLS